MAHPFDHLGGFPIPLAPLSSPRYGGPPHISRTRCPRPRPYVRSKLDRSSCAQEGAYRARCAQLKVQVKPADAAESRCHFEKAIWPVLIFAARDVKSKIFKVRQAIAQVPEVSQAGHAAGELVVPRLARGEGEAAQRRTVVNGELRPGSGWERARNVSDLETGGQSRQKP